MGGSERGTVEGGKCDDILDAKKLSKVGRMRTCGGVRRRRLRRRDVGDEDEALGSG